MNPVLAALFRGRGLEKSHHAPSGGQGPYKGGQFMPGDEAWNSKNYPVPTLPASLMAAINRPFGTVRADCEKLQRKHPDMFQPSKDVRAFLDYTFSRPDYAYPAHGGDGFVSIVRRGAGNYHAVVNFKSEPGQYRVTHATIIPDHQLAQHLGNTEVIWQRT